MKNAIRRLGGIFFALALLAWPTSSTQATRPAPDKDLCRSIKTNSLTRVLPIRTERLTATPKGKGWYVFCCYDDLTSKLATSKSSYCRKDDDPYDVGISSCQIYANFCKGWVAGALGHGSLHPAGYNCPDYDY